MQLNANGILLEAEQHGPGDGVPLILIRGLGTQLAHWPARLIDGFAAAGFRTIAFDNRDVGLSQRCPHPDVPGDAGEIQRRFADGQDMPAPYTVADMAGDVIALMDTLGIGRAHVLGISMVGIITQTLIIDHADRLASATLVMTVARQLMTREDNDPKAAAALLARLLSHPQDRQTYIDAQVEEHRNWGSPGYPMPESEIRAMAATTWDRGVDPEGINRQLLATAAAPDRRGELAGVTLPCLVIHGQDDSLIPEPMGADLAALIPASEYHAIAGMGHIITPKLAPIIVGLVSEFIRRRAG